MSVSILSYFDLTMGRIVTPQSVFILPDDPQQDDMQTQK